MRRKAKDKQKVSLLGCIGILVLICVIFILLSVVLSKVLKKDNLNIIKYIKNKFIMVEIPEKPVIEDLKKKAKEDEKIKEQGTEKKEITEVPEKEEETKKEPGKTDPIPPSPEVLEKQNVQKAYDIINKKHNPKGAYNTNLISKKSKNEYIISLVDPETTMVKAIYEVNIVNEETKDITYDAHI